MSNAKAGLAGEHKRFGALNIGGKIAYIGKVLAFVVTFGFAFPTIFSD